jgi:hypothetical protein
MEQDRRQVGNLRFEPSAGLLVVGGRTAVLEREPTAEVVIGTYVELVVAQREVPPASHIDLRNRELVVLADLLALPAGELDALIDRELARLLGPAAVISSLAGQPPTAIAPITRHRRGALLGLALILGAAAVTTAVLITTRVPAELPRIVEPSTLELPSGGTVEIIELPGGGTATRTESAPAEPGEDGTDVGTALLLERNP